MTESVISLALGVLAVCILIVGVVVLSGRRGQPLSLDVKGFGISVHLKREAETQSSKLQEDQT